MKKSVMASALLALTMVAAPMTGVANENQAARAAFGQCMEQLIKEDNLIKNAQLNERPLIEQAFMMDQHQHRLMKCLRKYFAVYEITASF